MVFVSAWAPVLIWAGFIFYLSSIPQLQSGLDLWWDFLLRKMAHVFEYAVLAALLVRAFRISLPRIEWKKTLMMSGLLAVFYAMTDEYHQSFVPGRGPSWVDVLIDSCGVILSLLVVMRWSMVKSALMKNKTLLLVITIAAFVTGCGPGSQLSRARSAEKKGKYEKAWNLYQEFAARNPNHEAAPEAMLRAGWLAQRQFKDCTMSGAFYDGILERYPQSEPWAKMARHQKNNCPDYYPLIAGSKWTEGDSDTFGKTARIEVICKPFDKKQMLMPSEAGVLERTYYAGASKFKSTEFGYKKTADELEEFSELSDPRPKVILKWPLEEGNRWITKSGGRTFQYEIIDTNATVTVKAGKFDGCLHVRSSIEGTPGANNEYYAPHVGRVLVTFSTKDGEKRNTELLSYETAEWPDVVTETEKDKKAE